MIEIEFADTFILFGVNYMNYDGDDGSEGHLLSIGFIIININIYF